MAEHPTHPNGSEDSPGTRENKKQTYENLRDLLLAPEKQEIAGLRRRIENPAIRAEDVSAVVAEAVELRRERGGGEALNRALTPSVEEALRESVRKDPSVLASALFPVMGPAIRKSIAESIRSMLESFNEALEHSFSVRGIRWRFESMRTGQPFAEIVLLHSLLYRVEQVFLIHKATGLVLGHCVAPRVATQDPALVSGMLSAIQSYVRDSFEAPKEDSLDSLQVGELEVWVADGPQAILAAVIRGHALASYRETLTKTIEQIHRDFGSALEHFDGDSAPLAAAEHELALCLESHYRPRESARRRPYLRVIGAVAMVAFAVWAAIAIRNEWKWNRFLDQLQSQPGIVVVSTGKEGGKHLVRGLRDPLASDPAGLLKDAEVDPGEVKYQWTPFYALDDLSVQKRAVDILKPPAGVALSVRDGVLEAAGQAPSEWAQALKDRATLVAGLKGVDASKLTSLDGPEIGRLEAALESVTFTFAIGSARAEPGEDANFANAAEQIKSLLAKTASRGNSTAIEVVGHTDVSGTEASNLSLSQQRADFVTNKLVEAGVARDSLRPRGVGTLEPVGNPTAAGDNRIERSVTLRVVPAKPNQEQ